MEEYINYVQGNVHNAICVALVFYFYLKMEHYYHLAMDRLVLPAMSPLEMVRQEMEENRLSSIKIPVIVVRIGMVLFAVCVITSDKVDLYLVGVLLFNCLFFGYLLYLESKKHVLRRN